MKAGGKCFYIGLFKIRPAVVLAVREKLKIDSCMISYVETYYLIQFNNDKMKLVNENKILF